MTDDKLWQYQDVANYLGVKESTVKLWAKKRTIPVIKVGGRIRFIPEVIREWCYPAVEVK